MRTVEQILEFDLVKKKLESYAMTEKGKKHLSELIFHKNRIIIEEELAKTKEALRIIFAFSRMPIEYIHNIEPYLQKAQRDGMLMPEELYRIGSQAKGIVQMQSFFQKVTIDQLHHIPYAVNSLHPCKRLQKEINDCITPQLEISDTASVLLNRLRKDIHVKEMEVRKRLEGIIRSKAEYLADYIITIRNDRLVIPVKSSYKNSVAGMVHDQSDSLQTVYIEPAAVIELNFEISRMRAQEKEEIGRILMQLTKRVREEQETLQSNLEFITELDVLFAKGQYGKDLDAYIPSISNQQEIYFPKAKHPLIDRQKVVANDYFIDGKLTNMMVITGPNTGGKTVSLKTIGLLTMMAQSGLALPTNEGARIGVFESFFVDIGDDQSIEDSLSTFSSHMSKLVHMTENVNEKSLVLLDEIGGGTNPNEGEAIAMALLDYFTSKHALVVATTHYSNLKSYALDKGNIAITSMEFDSSTMRPTYRLLRGVFGRSYAFEISQNLGLSAAIIQSAKAYKDYYASQIDQLTEKLDIQRIEIEARMQETLAQKKVLDAEKIALQKEIDNYTRLQKELTQRADDYVTELIEEATMEIEKVKANLLQQEQVKLHHVIDAKRQLETMKMEAIVSDSSNREFKIGDSVFIKSIRKNGKIIRKKGQNYVVSINGMMLGTTLDDLDIAVITDNKDTTPKHHISYQRSGNQVPLEILLIGMRVEEALEKCDKYVDDALSVHYKTIRIVHGHGTGALRKAVHQWLDNHPHVESYRLGGAGEGGLGATVATLK